MSEVESRVLRGILESKKEEEKGNGESYIKRKL